MLNKQIQKAYDHNKKIFHSLPENKGKQIAHIFEGSDKSTVLKACFYNFMGLTDKQHKDWKVLKQLREERYELRRQILNQYTKDQGCEGIGVKCMTCPLLAKP